MGGPPLGTVSFTLVDRCAVWSLVGMDGLGYLYRILQRIPSILCGRSCKVGDLGDKWSIRVAHSRKDTADSCNGMVFGTKEGTSH